MKKYIKPLLICSEIPHTQIAPLAANCQLNCNKNQIARFNKMQDTKAGDLRTDYGNKSQ